MTTVIAQPRRSSESRLDEALIAVGSGLVWSAILISTFRTRGQGDIDWSNYLVGIAATLGLLGVAAAAYYLVAEPVLKSDLMAWPGAFGALGVGLMIGVAMDDSDATLYLVGLAVAGLSAGGYYLTRRGAYLISGLIGVGVLYGQLFDDVIGFDDIDGDNFAMTIAAVLAVFTVGVTVAAWLLFPDNRDLTSIVAGVVSVVGISMTLFGLAVFGLVASAIAGAFDSPGPRRDNAFDNDIWVILLITAALCAGWAWCAWQTGHLGYRLLIVAMLGSVVPFATLILAVQHPTWWELVIGLMGAAALGFVAVRAMGGVDQVRARLTSRGGGQPS